MNPRILRDYESELYDFVEKIERAKAEVYPCSKGVPTIGVGYALAEQSGGTFRIRVGIDEDLAKIGKALTTADRKRLITLCNMLNNGTIKQSYIGNTYKDPFDLTVTEEQAKQLFRLCIPKYDAVLREKLGLKLYKQLQNSHEMVALFSLAYNAPSLIGKNLVAGLREGNRAKVQEGNKGVKGNKGVRATHLTKYL